MFQVRMGVPWVAWIRCATNILGAQQKQQISKMILDFLSRVLLVPFIYNAQIHIVIICIAMEVFTTTPNGLDRLIFTFSVGDVISKKSKLEYKVCRSTPMCIVLCHARIIYVHSTSLEMSKVCIHLGV
jgi:hypothetical protein